MWHVTLRGLFANKTRLALTAIAIVVGVTFISGTYILTDTLHSTFTSLVGNVFQKLDFEVRGDAQLTSSGASAVRNPIPESILSSVRRVPGVMAANGSVQGYAQFVARDGDAISSSTGTLGLSYDPNHATSELRIVQGTAPTSAHDVLMDAGTATKYDFTEGERVRVLLPNSEQWFTITGIVQFGTANNLAGGTLAGFTLRAAQARFQEKSQLNDIYVVTTPHANEQKVGGEIASVLPHGVQVVTGQTVINEETNAINQALGSLSTALLVFALVALFVGAFTILNTFSIVVGQRTKELALLRVVGASRRQIFRSVIGEAAVVGLMSSLIGLGLGVLAALGLEALLRAFGIDLPSGSLVFAARTAIVSLLVGVGVTVLAAISPARRAVRIPPVAAITGVALESVISFRRRSLGGGSLALLGAVALGLGLSAHTTGLVGLGALGLFVSVAMLAPALARPLASAIGRPFARVLGVAGSLGRENAMRSPRRTAQTASALMVGIALVSAIAVFGASASKSATASVDEALSANLIVTGSGAFANSVVPAVSKVPGVTSSSSVYAGQFEVRQSLESLKAITTKNLSSTLILHMTAGSARALSKNELLIDARTAKSENLSLGERVAVTFARTGPSTMRVGGIYQANALVGSYLVSQAFYLSHYTTPLPSAVLLRTDGRAGVERSVNRALNAYPTVGVQSRAQFERSQTKQVNVLLGLVDALLALAVLVALIGIVNTLMLSVLERTREIGLLHAVGMKRRQIRTMIRSEAVILSVFGTLIGIVLGTGLGIALVSSLRSQGVTDVFVPFSSLVVYLVLSVVLGLVAASWPARRAAKLDVLAAIATT